MQSNVAYKAEMQSPKPTGIHGSASQTYNRLCELNRGVGNLLNRVRGCTVESQAGQAVPAPNDPSLITHLGNVDSELCHLEKQLNELVEQIG